MGNFTQGFLQGSPLYAFLVTVGYQAFRYRRFRKELISIVLFAAAAFTVWSLYKGSRIEDIPKLMQAEIGKLGYLFSISSPAAAPTSFVLMLYKKTHRIIRALARAVFSAGIIGVVCLVLMKTGYLPVIHLF